MKDDCPCYLCVIRRELEKEPEFAKQGNTGEAQGRSDSDIERDLAETQANLNRAKTVGILTDSLRKAWDMGDTNVAGGIQRALELVLPPTPSQEKAAAATCPSPDTQEAPQQTDLADLPPEIRKQIEELQNVLGVKIPVFRFPLA